MSGELRSLLKGEEKKVLAITKIGMVVFALAALIFSLISSDQLVLLARVSFAGTALMAPMIISAMLATGKTNMIVVWVTALAKGVFIASLLGIIPAMVSGVRMDLLLFIFLGVLTAIVNLLEKRKAETPIAHQ